MSELAAAYYQERAVRLGIENVPDILNGQPILLLGDGHEQRLSLQQPNPDRLAEVTGRYATIVHSLDDFILSAYSVSHPGYRRGTSTRQEAINNRHIDSMVEAKLFPSYLKAGRVTDIQIEAIARSEVEPGHIRKAGESTSYYYDEKTEDHEVYLLTTGALFAGRSLGYTACTTLITAVWASEGKGISPQYMGVSFKRNELLARSGLKQSRAIRNYIDMWGIANPQLQNVRRGGRQHGKGGES
jgi:hypothetical protein